MKSLAIVGMMFLSMGLFAQRSSEVEIPVKEKYKVCAKKCDKAQEFSKMKKAPMRKVDARKSSVKSGNGQAVKRHGLGNAKKVYAQKRKMVIPLRKKSVKIDEKM